MPIATIWELSQRWYEGRLDPDFRPPGVEHFQQLLSDVGLVSDFWQFVPSGPS